MAVKLYGLPWTIMSVTVPLILYLCTGGALAAVTQALPPVGVVWVAIPLCLVALQGSFPLYRAIRKRGDSRLQRVYSRQAEPPVNVYIEFVNGEHFPLETKFEHYCPDSDRYVWEVEVTPEYAALLATDQARLDCEDLPSKTVLHVHAHGATASTDTRSGEQ